MTDMRYESEDLMRQLQRKSDEVTLLQKDVMSWKEVVERMNSENKEL